MADVTQMQAKIAPTEQQIEASFQPRRRARTKPTARQAADRDDYAYSRMRNQARFGDRYRLSLQADEALWLNGLARDEAGQVKRSIADANYMRLTGDATPRMAATAGTGTNVVYLKPACQAIAHAALVGDPNATVDVKPIVDWLEAGAPLELILEEITQFINWLGPRYEGFRSFKFFNRAVLGALARFKAGIA